ncbi:MAG: hypothetical protein LBH46_01750 [Rickettsiales bacterium]|jgi:hypothetical protein|nr:hypothetical protein [Rickettsiales bacterium]
MYPINFTHIANSVLLILGETEDVKDVENIDENSTSLEIKFNKCSYDIYVRALKKMLPNFAMITLEVDYEDKLIKPTDCVTLIKVNNNKRFNIIGNEIVLDPSRYVNRIIAVRAKNPDTETATKQAKLVYISNNKDLLQYADVDFIEYLEYSFIKQIGYNITKNSNLVEKKIQEMQQFEINMKFHINNDNKTPYL